MALLGPNEPDTAKLHSEVSQIVSQRLLVTTLAVTVFGATVAWLLPTSPPSIPQPIGMFRYLASSLLTLVLLVLFVLTHHLSQMLRTFTTYLDETGASNWEKDWKRYREKFPYLGYTKPQALVFVFLCSISTSLPFLLMLAYPFRPEPVDGMVICLLSGLLSLILVVGMGIGEWFAREDDLRRRWRELKDS